MSTASSEPPATISQLTDERLWEHYDRCIDEYRFQVNLNWSRSQYFFVLNVGVLIAGIGLLSASPVPTAAPIVVFLLGALCAGIAMLVSRTQHGYYRNIRDLKQRLEVRLALGDDRIATTPGMGGVRARLARLTTLQAVVLGALCLADLFGAAVSIVAAAEPDEPRHVQAIVRTVPPADSVRDAAPVVLSQDGRVVASIAPQRGRALVARVRPGAYDVFWQARDRVCVATVTIAPTPLQRVDLIC
jgi:hypothetical protein